MDEANVAALRIVRCRHQSQLFASNTVDLRFNCAPAQRLVNAHGAIGRRRNKLVKPLAQVGKLHMAAARHRNERRKHVVVKRQAPGGQSRIGAAARRKREVSGNTGIEQLRRCRRPVAILAHATVQVEHSRTQAHVAVRHRNCALQIDRQNMRCACANASNSGCCLLNDVVCLIRTRQLRKPIAGGERRTIRTQQSAVLIASSLLKK